MTRTITGALLLAVLSALCIHAAVAQDAPKATAGLPLVTSRPIPVAYWIAECVEGPMPAPEAVRRWDRPGEASALYQLVDGRVMAEAVVLGSREKGWTAWSVVGPLALYKAQASDPKACRTVTTYAEARAGDELWKDWVTARSTCVGVEKAKPTAAAVAPCSDPKTAEIDVKAITPPVDFGKNDPVAAAAFAAEKPPPKPSGEPAGKVK